MIAMCPIEHMAERILRIGTIKPSTNSSCDEPVLIDLYQPLTRLMQLDAFVAFLAQSAKVITSYR